MRFTRGEVAVTVALDEGKWAVEGDTRLSEDMRSALALPCVEFLRPWKIPNKEGSLRSILAVSLAVGADLDESTATTEEIRERNWLRNGGSHRAVSDDDGYVTY